tara:strand:+ start:231 stop:401 length:171 start_codon:yes stop_codon:yes gene_type:complete
MASMGQKILTAGLAETIKEVVKHEVDVITDSEWFDEKITEHVNKIIKEAKNDETNK